MTSVYLQVAKQLTTHYHTGVQIANGYFLISILLEIITADHHSLKFLSKIRRIKAEFHLMYFFHFWTKSRIGVFVARKKSINVQNVQSNILMEVPLVDMLIMNVAWNQNSNVIYVNIEVIGMNVCRGICVLIRRLNLA